MFVFVIRVTARVFFITKDKIEVLSLVPFFMGLAGSELTGNVLSPAQLVSR